MGDKVIGYMFVDDDVFGRYVDLFGIGEGVEGCCLYGGFDVCIV